MGESTHPCRTPTVVRNNEYADMDSMISTFNTAVTETASEIPGKHHQKKKAWVTVEILDLSNKRRGNGGDTDEGEWFQTSV